MKTLLLTTTLAALLLSSKTPTDTIVNQYKNIVGQLKDNQITELMLSNFLDCSSMGWDGTLTIQLGKKKAKISCKDLKKSFDDYNKEHVPDAPAKKSVDPTV